MVCISTRLPLEGSTEKGAVGGRGAVWGREGVLCGDVRVCENAKGREVSNI